MGATAASSIIMVSSQYLLIISLLILCLLTAPTSAASSCPERCGEVDIKYPFGIGLGCFFPGFEVTCMNQSVPFLSDSPYSQLVEIILSNGEVRVDSTPYFSDSTCLATSQFGPTKQIKLLHDSPFTFSLDANSLVVVGCNVGAAISDTKYFKEFSGCKSLCHSLESMDNGSCTGNGCCEVPIPRAKKSLSLFAYVGDEGIETQRNISSCCKGYVVEEGSYEFNRLDVWRENLSGKLTTKLEWAIGQGRNACDAEKTICGSNSYCEESRRRDGYLCNCKPGYRGNPYESQGCSSDCDSETYNPCVSKATCQENVKGITCACKPGSNGDGFRNGSGCYSHFPLVPVLKLVGALSISFICILFLSHWIQKKRDQARTRAECFRHNGGLLLQQHILNKYSATKHVKIFSVRELEKATNNYDSSKVLGFGGQGTVYKGILKDGTPIAIKKSQLVAQSQVKQFINELLILVQINHRNIVKLIGFCLETQVPLLVYEFIPGGNLYNKIHQDMGNLSRYPWKERLRIAIEVAEALSYLHSYASMPIFHRDVKSSNILLNENGTGKLADFGVSRLVPLDKVRVSTVVQGTIGYLDPEYFNTGMLTEKSDVYSYGVVLLELLTGRKPIRHEDTRDYSSLVMHFQSYVGRKKLLEILDESISVERNMEELKVVAGIASRCLNVLGDERPTMKMVVQELSTI